MLNGWPKQTPDYLQVFKTKQLELTIEGKCLMWGHRIVIPSKMRPQVLGELHSAHAEVIKNETFSQILCLEANIDKDIELIGKECLLCLENSSNPPRAVFHVWDWPDKPKDRVHADFLGPVEGQMYLIIVDAHSKWVEIKVMKDVTASTTIEALKEYLVNWGIPFKLVTDNGPTFTSSEFADFMNRLGVKHILVAPDHPASNGLAENAVRSFKDKFEILIKEMS